MDAPNIHPSSTMTLQITLRKNKQVLYPYIDVTHCSHSQFKYNISNLANAGLYRNNKLSNYLLLCLMSPGNKYLSAKYLQQE